MRRIFFARYEVLQITGDFCKDNEVCINLKRLCKIRTVKGGPRPTSLTVFRRFVPPFCCPRWAFSPYISPERSWPPTLFSLHPQWDFCGVVLLYQNLQETVQVAWKRLHEICEGTVIYLRNRHERGLAHEAAPRIPD